MLFKNKQKLNKKFVAIIFAMICLFSLFPTFKNSNNVNAVSFGSGTIGSASSKLYGLGTTASPFEIWKYSDLVLMSKILHLPAM